jgi:cyclopropane-fatty-acyl-phospholipid synthase
MLHINTYELNRILEGDTIFIFGENESTCPLKSILKIHSPQFYWKVMTLADLGLADAYINGDFSFVDKDSGLLNLIMVHVTYSTCAYMDTYFFDCSSYF